MIMSITVEVELQTLLGQNQEFVSRGVLVALMVTILGGFAKLFEFMGNP